MPSSFSWKSKFDFPASIGTTLVGPPDFKVPRFDKAAWHCSTKAAISSGDTDVRSVGA